MEGSTRLVTTLDASMNASIEATKHPGDRSEVTKRQRVAVRPQPSSNRSPPYRSQQRSHQSASIIERSISILIDPKSNDPSDQESKPASSPSRQSDDRYRGSTRIVTSIDASIKASIETTKDISIPKRREQTTRRSGKTTAFEQSNPAASKSATKPSISEHHRTKHQHLTSSKRRAVSKQARGLIQASTQVS
jgi:hypothetical protein